MNNNEDIDKEIGDLMEGTQSKYENIADLFEKVRQVRRIFKPRRIFILEEGAEEDGLCEPEIWAKYLELERLVYEKYGDLPKSNTIKVY